MSEGPLVNLGELSKPATVLIEKVSKAVGGIAAPHQIKRVAKAEAAVIKAQSDIEITDLHRRAAQRRIEEDARHQKNMEDITEKAIPHINENANPNDLDDDWIANLFDKCRIVSDEEMQSLWARVLVTEANTPGTLSKRTVNRLSDFDKSDAELFTNLCGFGWMIGKVVPLVFDFQADIYSRHGINFDTLSFLEVIGLIQLSELTGFSRIVIPKRGIVSYYGKSLLLEIPADANNKLSIGMVRLTKIGEELAPICGSQPVEGFYEYVKERWKEYLPAAEKD